MIFSNIDLEEFYPLTCSLEGTCCYGNNVYINPWEIYNLSIGLKINPKEFISLHSTEGGIKLAFNGAFEKNSKKSCNLYDNTIGCSIHSKRPLACRLFPVGRKIQFDKTTYFFEGKNHPCSHRCPSAVDLPKIKLKDYLTQQKTENFEIIQDQYLEIIQNIADTAFALYLETDAKISDKGKTLKGWEKWTKITPYEIIQLQNEEWKKNLLYPFEIELCYDESSFIQNHALLLENKIQEEINSLSNLEAIINFSINLMGISTILGNSIGANMKEILKQWIMDAKEFSKQ
jgi:Fe-S-cluster containining protein